MTRVGQETGELVQVRVRKQKQGGWNGRGRSEAGEAQGRISTPRIFYVNHPRYSFHMIQNSLQVSLGGKSRNKTQETKNDFVERTRKEREARESARKRENAAIALQVILKLLLKNPVTNHPFSHFSEAEKLYGVVGWWRGQSGMKNSSTLLCYTRKQCLYQVNCR